MRKGVAPKNYLDMDYDTLAQEIEEVRNFFPASEKQIQMIKDKIANLNDNVNLNIKMPSEAELKQLTGGMAGTASAMIDSLMKLEQQYADEFPPSDKQLEFIVNMYLCPDVPFEDFGVSRKVDLENGLWRKPTPDEFAEECRKAFRRNTASKFIDDYRGTFHTWRSTRIRPSQKKYIRQLEERMSNLSSPRAIQFAVTPEGAIIQVQDTNKDNADKYNPTGYKLMDDMYLDMYSTEEASKYIDTLKAELANKSMYRYGERSDNTMTFEDLRKPKTVESLKKNEYTTLNDLMFKLDAVAGYENEKVHNAVSTLLLEGLDDERTLNAKQTIRDFMMYLMDEDFIGWEGLAELCKDCDIAKEILLSR
jgi:hypothetical protein